MNETTTTKDDQKQRDQQEQADLRAIRALQGAPLEGCGDNDCDDCYPK